MIIMTKEEVKQREAAGTFVRFSDGSGQFPNMDGRRAIFCRIPEHECTALLIEGVGFIVEGEEDKWPNPTRRSPLAASGVISPLGDSGAKKPHKAINPENLKVEFSKHAESFHHKLEWLKKNPDHDYYHWELKEACEMLGRCEQIADILSRGPGESRRAEMVETMRGFLHEVIKNR